MLHFATLRQSALETAVSLLAQTNRQGTGGWYQLGLLRLMGVAVVGPVAIAPGTSFLGAHHLRLGRYVTIGANSRLVSWAPVEIGDDFMASDQLNINTGAHDPVTLQPAGAPVKIGRRVWCGTGVTICAGVEIGDDVVIGAGSVVTKSLPANCIAYGVPARPARTLDRPAGQGVWSMWPERAAGGRLEDASPLKRRLHWLRARL